MQTLNPTIRHAFAEEADGITRYLHDFVPVPSHEAKIANITPREKEIIQLMAEGFSTKEIAKYLCISFHTVESYRKTLLHKMGARNIVHLIAKASKMFFIG